MHKPSVLVSRLLCRCCSPAVFHVCHVWFISFGADRLTTEGKRALAGPAVQHVVTVGFVSSQAIHGQTRSARGKNVRLHDENHPVCNIHLVVYLRPAVQVKQKLCFPASEASEGDCRKIWFPGI